MMITQGQIEAGDRIRANLKGSTGTVTGVVRFNWTKLLVLETGSDDDAVTIPWSLVATAERLGRKFETGLYVSNAGTGTPSPEALASKIVWKFSCGKWEAITPGVQDNPADRLGPEWESRMVRLHSEE